LSLRQGLILVFRFLNSTRFSFSCPCSSVFDAYHKKGIINDTIAQKKDALQRMESQMERLTTGKAVAEKAIADWTPMLEIDVLNEDIVDLLISKILVHGENDVEIVWQGAADRDLP